MEQENIEQVHESELTENQQNFLNYYLDSKNATRSYEKAFPNASLNTCKVEGSKLLKHPLIHRILFQRAEDLKVKSNLTRESMIRDLTATAEQAKSEQDYASYARLKDMVIRMVGFYEPTKVEHTSLQIQLTIPGLSPSNVKSKTIDVKSTKHLELDEHKESDEDSTPSEPDSSV